MANPGLKRLPAGFKPSAATTYPLLSFTVAIRSFALHGIPRLTFVPFELFLQVRLSVGGPRQSTQGNLELPSATRANSDCRSGTQPSENFKIAFAHRELLSKCQEVVYGNIRLAGVICCTVAASTAESRNSRWLITNTVKSSKSFRRIFRQAITSQGSACRAKRIWSGALGLHG